MRLQRGQQVLKLLFKHGPLSSRDLQRIIGSEISIKKVRRALKRLQNKSLVTTRNDKIFGRAGVYYQLSQNPCHSKAIAALLNVPRESIKQPYFRHAELIHSAECAIWSERFEKLLPHARVIRENAFYKNKDVQRTLLSSHDDFESLPDILILYPTSRGQMLSVAIEIELSEKSKRRLAAKLQRLAKGTLLDGVIYICGIHIISERLQHIYKARVFDNALRIKHYGDNFFLFSDGENSLNSDDMKLFNSALQPVSLKSWIHKLSNTEMDKRRNEMFAQGGYEVPLGAN